MNCFLATGLTWETHSEREVDREPANHILRDMVLSVGVYTEPDASVKNCLEVTREAMQNPCVRYVKIRDSEPRIVAVCHGEPYGRNHSVTKQESIQISHLVHSVRHFSPGVRIPNTPEYDVQCFHPRLPR